MATPEVRAADRQETLKERFDELLDLEPVERERQLAAIEGADSALAAKLRELLGAADSTPSGFLDPIQPPTPAVPGADVHEAPTNIGPFHIDGLLGRGGMACVWRATQSEPLPRTVALKVIRPELDGREFGARFEAERLVLSRLDHPGVARVLDAGRDPDGRAWFAMDLVDGPPITDYAREHKLDLAQRVRLVVDAARGVQHAHSRGVLHRDLKPSNLLVEEREGLPVPKVIDFGVAKAFGDERAKLATQLTRAGELLGTLEYMSPEQAGLGQREIDVRADIYSMGVVLYELMTGSRPIELEGQGLAGVSDFLQRLSGQASQAPRQRGFVAQPGALSREALGDLDCVVRQAIEPDPCQRYDTMAAFADDLERVLEDRPVIASPPSRATLVTRFLRRNRWFALGGFTVLCSLILALGATAFGLSRSVAQARALEASQLESEQVADFFGHMVREGRSDQLGAQAPYSEVLERAGARVLEDEELPPGVRGRIAASLAETLIDMELREAADPLLELADRMLASVDPTPAIRRAHVSALVHRGMRDLDRGDLEGAEEHFRRARELRAGMRVADLDALLAVSDSQLADLMDERGDSVAAARIQRNSIELLRASDPQSGYLEPMRASLAITLAHAGDYAAAEQVAREVFAERRARLPVEDYRVTNIARVLADTLRAQGRLDEAVDLLAELTEGMALDPQDPRRLQLDVSLARLRLRQDPSERRAAELDALLGRARELAPGQPRIQLVFDCMALEPQLVRGAAPDALPIDEIFADLEATLGSDSPDALRAHLEIGRMLHRFGWREAAAPHLTAALEQVRRRSSVEPPLAEELLGLLAAAD